MLNKLLVLPVCFIASFSSARASELKDAVQKTSEHLKKDSTEISDALKEDYERSSKIISKEADKIMAEIKSLKEDLSRHGKAADKSREEISETLGDKIDELKDIIDSID
ncbi:MAG: hypothetical protein LW817_02795 [Candidatus Caenarcaniphilales bacterium]|jgi:septal ring factor EnvC (AmiA/AmiB activator)|nr:hypothetical protein [Candidatus Caenarcaniphilales bacterium]